MNVEGKIMTGACQADEKQRSEIENALNLLDAIDGQADHSQRSLAVRLNVALGLANSLLKRCVRKGLIKIKEAPTRRFAYYLTPQGFGEKSRLVAEYLSLSLDFFRTARDQYDSAFAHCDAQGWTRIVLVGTGDLAEIAVIASHSCQADVLGVIDPGRNVSAVCGLPVYNNLDELNDVDAVIVVDTTAPQAAFDGLVTKMSAERVLTPDVLRVSRNAIVAGGKGA